MKTHLVRLVLPLLAGSSLLLTSCEYPYHGYSYRYGPNQRAGTVYGAAGGALLGGIIGNQSRRPLQGALIGGVLGGLAGNAIGASRDRSYYVRSGPVYSRPYSYGRPYYSSRYYQPAYSTWGYSRPNYCYRPSYYGSSLGYRTWGGSLGYVSPFGWGPPWY